MSKLKSITIEEDDKIMVINPRPATTVEYTQEYEEELPDKYNRLPVYQTNMFVQRKLVGLTIHIYDEQGLEGVIRNDRI